MIFILCIIVTFILLFVYFNRLYSRFSSHGVKHFKAVPLFGNMLPIILKKEHVVSHLHRMHRKFCDQRFNGRYEFINCAVLVRDLDLIKKITVRDFDHFSDHRDFTDEVQDELLTRGLFSLRGQEWKDMRNFLSPIFTSSKMKSMVPFIQEVGDQMIADLKRKLKQSKNSYIDVDCKDLAARFATDAIASCVFGIKVDSYKEPKNQFFCIIRDVLHMNFCQFVLFFAYAAFPAVFKKLNITIMSKDASIFFKDLITKAMKEREERNIIRPDIIHLFMEARKGNLKNYEKIPPEDIKEASVPAEDEKSHVNKNINTVWSDADLVAQAVVFLLAGFETVSAAVKFSLYELAVNQDVQDRLFQEIKEIDDKYGEKLDLATIQGMEYMDMVLSEVLRLWPPVAINDRRCVKEYNLGKPNDNAPSDFVIRKGEIVLFSVWSLHRDPKHYDDPEMFNPERFSKQNRHLIKPLTYMPFGIGQRNCIGSRFALCEVKIQLFYMIKNMQVLPTEKTIYPSKLSARTNNIELDNGHWLRFRSRD